MKKIKAWLQENFLRTPYDWKMILATVFLMVIGIIMIYSASYYYAESSYHYAPYHFALNQLKNVLIGLALAIPLSMFRPAYLKKVGFLALLLSYLVILILLIPGFRLTSHGASRWVKIGPISFQAAEPAKLGMIVFIAYAISHKKFAYNWKNVLILVGILGVLAAMVLFISNNLSSAIILMIIGFCTIMLLSPKMKYYIWVIIGIVLLAVLIVLIVDLTPYNPSENFRFTRIRAWLHPTNELFIDNQAYQPVQAKYAIASGGLIGKGLGQSLIKFKLPEPHNDYILAITFEELGLLGVGIITYLFGYILYRIFRVYTETDRRDKFSRALVLGVFFHLASQIILNYAVTLGLFPTMGVTLPFISAGGSSAIFLLLELAIVLAIDRDNKDRAYYLLSQKIILSRDPLYKRLLEQGYQKQDMEGDDHE